MKARKRSGRDDAQGAANENFRLFHCFLSLDGRMESYRSFLPLTSLSQIG